MPKKAKNIIVELKEPESEYIEPEILPVSTNISKKTGKVKKILSEKQLAVLAEGRIKGLEARRKLSEHLNLKVKTEILKEERTKNKIEKTKIKEAKIKKNIDINETNQNIQLEYEEVKEDIFKDPPKQKKIKKKIIKYVEESSDSETDGEVIIKTITKKQNNKYEMNDEILKKKLYEDKVKAMTEYLKPQRY